MVDPAGRQSPPPTDTNPQGDPSGQGSGEIQPPPRGPRRGAREIRHDPTFSTHLAAVSTEAERTSATLPGSSNEELSAKDQQKKLLRGGSPEDIRDLKTRLEILQEDDLTTEQYYKVLRDLVKLAFSSNEDVQMQAIEFLMVRLTKEPISTRNTTKLDELEKDLFGRLNDYIGKAKTRQISVPILQKLVATHQLILKLYLLRRAQENVTEIDPVDQTQLSQMYDKLEAITDLKEYPPGTFTLASGRQIIARLRHSPENWTSSITQALKPLANLFANLLGAGASVAAAPEKIAPCIDQAIENIKTLWGQRHTASGDQSSKWFDLLLSAELLSEGLRVGQADDLEKTHIELGEMIEDLAKSLKHAKQDDLYLAYGLIRRLANLLPTLEDEERQKKAWSLLQNLTTSCFVATSKALRDRLPLPSCLSSHPVEHHPLSSLHWATFYYFETLRDHQRLLSEVNTDLKQHLLDLPSAHKDKSATKHALETTEEARVSLAWLKLVQQTECDDIVPLPTVMVKPSAPRRLPHFVGRIDKIKELIEDGPNSLKPGRIVIIYAPAGMGKTSLIKEVMHLLRKLLEENRLFSDMDYFSFYDRLVSPHVVRDTSKLIEHWLTVFDIPNVGSFSETNLIEKLKKNPSLFVIDGEEQARQGPKLSDILNGMPRESGFVVTTRDKHPFVNLVGWDVRYVTLGALESHESVEMLKKILIQDPRTKQIPLQRSQMEAIHEYLDGYPLHLWLTGNKINYYQGNRARIDSYLELLADDPIEGSKLDIVLARDIQQMKPFSRELLATMVHFLARAPVSDAVLKVAFKCTKDDIEQDGNRNTLRHYVEAIDELIDLGYLVDTGEADYQICHLLIRDYIEKHIDIHKLAESASQQAALQRLISYFGQPRLQPLETEKNIASLKAELPHALRLLDICRNKQEWVAVKRLAQWATPLKTLYEWDDYRWIQHILLEYATQSPKPSTGLQALFGSATPLHTDRALEARSLFAIGFSHIMQSNYEEARKHFREAGTIYEVLGNPHKCAYSLMTIGVTHRNEGRHELAREYFQRALDYNEISQEPLKFRNPLIQADSQFGRALAIIMLKDQHSFQLAAKDFQEAIDLFQRIGDKTGHAYCELGLGHLHLALEKCETAQEHFTNAHKLFVELKDSSFQQHCLKALAQVAIAKGDDQILTDYLEQLRSLYTRTLTANKREEKGRTDLMQEQFRQTPIYYRNCLEILSIPIESETDYTREVEETCDLQIGYEQTRSCFRTSPVEQQAENSQLEQATRWKSKGQQQRGHNPQGAADHYAKVALVFELFDEPEQAKDCFNIAKRLYQQGSRQLDRLESLLGQIKDVVQQNPKTTG